MEIRKYLNVSKEEVENKTHNIWLGISLGNKYFTKENIRKYLLWALDYTKHSVLIVIGDAIHAVNLEVLDHKSPHAAFRKALKLGDKKFDEISSIINELTEDKKIKVKLARWKDILEVTQYQTDLIIIKDEFKSNKEFHDLIIDIVVCGRQDRSETLDALSPNKLDRLAEYILNELPHFINGVQGYGDNQIYTLLPYPGLSKLDELIIGLQNKTIFPELTRKLQIKNKIGI